MTEYVRKFESSCNKTYTLKAFTKYGWEPK